MEGVNVVDSNILDLNVLADVNAVVDVNSMVQETTSQVVGQSSQAIEVIQGMQPSQEIWNYLFQLPTAIMELVRIAPLALVLLVAETYLLRHFVFSRWIPTGALSWAVSFFVTLVFVFPVTAMLLLPYFLGGS